MKVERNALESARFGVAFARLVEPVVGGDLSSVLRAADDGGVDVISTRVGSGSLPLVHQLEACGFRLMDSLVYHRATLPAVARAPRPSELIVSVASERDVDACARIAAAAFHDYLGHYHADPRLDPACADAAYVDWTRNLLRNADEGDIALCARAGDAVVGYLVGTRRAAGVSEIVLNAVDPLHQGRGCYDMLLGAYLRAAEVRGDREVVISTQLQNYRVQRAWQRHGLVLFDCFYTLHRWRPETCPPALDLQGNQA